jgi:hypothetical protein
VHQTEVTFLTVGTPEQADGTIDLRYVITEKLFLLKIIQSIKDKIGLTRFSVPVRWSAEALAYKCSLVSTNNGNRDYVVHKKLRLLSPSKDRRRLAENLVRMVLDRELPDNLESRASNASMVHLG